MAQPEQHDVTVESEHLVELTGVLDARPDIVINAHDGAVVNVHVAAPERGVDDDDGTVDHNITGDINLDDDTWEHVRSYDLDYDGHRRDFLDLARLAPLVVTHTRQGGHCDTSPCTFVDVYRRKL